MKEKEILSGILAEYFKYYRYNEAINKVRLLYSQEDSLFKKKWKEIKFLIQNRKFEIGEPLNFLVIDANLPLDEDSDEEAYKWLDLLVKNLESNFEIIEY